MGTFRILSLDPGGVTGWATYTTLRMMPPDSNEYEYLDEEWAGGQLGEWTGKKFKAAPHHEELETLIEMSIVEEFLVVCESFNYRNASPAGLELISRDYIGIVDLLAKKRGFEVVKQEASFGKVTKKSFVRKENLEKLGLWVKGGASVWNHQMDAYGHLLQYMIKNGIRKNYLLEIGWK